MKMLFIILFSSVALLFCDSIMAQKEIIMDQEDLTIELLNTTDQTSLQIFGGNLPFSYPSISLTNNNNIKLNGSVSDFDGGYLYMRDFNNRITLELFGDRLPGTGTEDNYAQLRLVGDSDALFIPSPQTGPFIPLLKLENDIENQFWELGVQGHVRGVFPNFLAETELVFSYNTDEVANIDEHGNYTVVSDQNKKRDITTLSPVLQKLMHIQPSSYCFKNSYAPCDQIGFIAQNIQEQFPSLVRSRNSDNEEYLMMNYQGMIPVTVKAIQEQQVLIEEQRQQIHRQEELINELFKRIKQLESKI